MDIITKRTNLTMGCTIIPPTGGAGTRYTENWWYMSGFRKPDVNRRNPKVDGYRSPSPWRGDHLYNKFSRASIAGSRQVFDSTYEYFGETHAIQSNLGGWYPNVNELRSKILNNLRKEIVDLSMVVAELRATANTLGDNLLRLGRSMDQFRLRRPDSYSYLLSGSRNLKRRPTERFLKETADSYLEWKYGIMPTIYDIQGACEGLDVDGAGNLFSNPPLLVARSRVEANGTVNANLSCRSMFQRGHYWQGPARYERSIAARLDYRISGELLRGLNRYGLGLGSVATVVWDNSPFSFVLDWVLPMSELIKAWSALAGVHVVGYSETHFEKNFSVGHDYWPWPDVVITVEDGEETSRFWRRETYPTVPFPIPYLKNPIKVNNIQSALALFTSLWSNVRA